MTTTNAELTNLRTFFEKLAHRSDGIEIPVAELETDGFYASATLQMSIFPAGNDDELAARIKNDEPVACDFEERVVIFERQMSGDSDQMVNLGIAEESHWLDEDVAFDWQQIQKDPAGAAEEYKRDALQNRELLSDAVNNYRERVEARWADYDAVKAKEMEYELAL